MREIQSEIEINATPDQVWNALMDFSAWASWNPIIHSADGQAGEGNTLRMAMMGKDGQASNRYNPTITTFESPRHFRWRTKVMGGLMMTNDKQFHLEATDSGTRLIHSEFFSGLMVPLFWSKLDAGVKPMLDSMNAALKEKLENQ